MLVERIYFMELEAKYEPKKVEDKIYKFWSDNNLFHANINKDKKPYTIVIPPPNITGKLHMGHALDETLQDILIRFKRMQGFEALWVPGVDHASIATEAKIVEQIKKEGLTKEELGRENFLKRAWDWKEKYSNTILNQLKKLGSSCDWSKARFTLDEGCNKAVNHVFVKLYKKGLIYKGERIINWCPHCKTSISDAEVEFKEQQGSFWHIKYPLADKSGYLELATTRPETMFGDTAVAVNPNDERYKKFIGKTLILPIIGREIPVIADDYVDPAFGTGVVKITPAHDPNDFEVGLRHNLPIIKIMNNNAVLNKNAGKYCNLDRYEARKKVVEELKELGLLVDIKPHTHNVGTCYRCNTTVEPVVSKQWFVKMQPLAKPAIDAVKNSETKFIPERFSKIYFHWLENIKDWCISRQLWWGHRIPVWYCQDCGEVIVSENAVKTCPKCGSSNLKQDEDTLDTWFSSALWPFSTLGWPEKTKELEYFYPTSTLVTGYDIIFFWVVRMIFSALEHTGEVPFENVFIHGLVRDSQGRKMSKSLGNGIDPLEIIEKYGADALRFSLATGNSPGNDMRFTEEKIEASRNFANKIWNAARFIHMNIDNFDIKDKLPKNLQIEDKWIISRFNNLSHEINYNLEKFELGVAVQKIYDFIWEEFCDWYIELAKIRLNNEDDEKLKNNTRQVLVWVFNGILKLLHPFMPFITEEIWQTMPHEGKAIAVAKFPEFDKNNEYIKEQENISEIMQLIKAVRNLRANMNVKPSKKADVYIETNCPEIFSIGEIFIKKLAFANNIFIKPKFDLKNTVTAVTSNAKVHILTDELINKEEEISRLSKKLEKLKNEIKPCLNKLQNEAFINKAPKEIVEKTKQKYAKLNEQQLLLQQSLNELRT